MDSSCLIKMLPSFYFLENFNSKYICAYLLLFLIHVWQRKHSFGVKFWELRFWWIYTFWDLLNRKVSFLAVGLCVCICMCYQHNLVAETLNLIFYIYIIYRCYLNLFVKIGWKISVQEHTKQFEYIISYRQNFLLIFFNIFRLIY